MLSDQLKQQLRQDILQVMSLRNMIKDLEKRKIEAELKLEATMIQADPINTSIEFDNFKVTRSATIKYSLDEEGQKLLSQYSYETAYWNKTPNMVIIREDDILKDHVVEDRGKTKLTLKEMANEK